MKKLWIPALMVVAVVVLSGCAQQPTATPTPTKTATPTATAAKTPSGPLPTLPPDINTSALAGLGDLSKDLSLEIK